MEGAPPTEIEPLVAALQEAHGPIQGIGVKDFESYGLFVGLRAIGEERRGVEILREYVHKHRRSLWPLTKDFQAGLNLPEPERIATRSKLLTERNPVAPSPEELSVR
jgi:hypothetical protein